MKLIDTEKVAQAVSYAATAHGEQVRKGTPVPYLTHLLAVCSLALDHGATTHQAQAAVLHDVVEDCGGLERLADVREVFGDEVAEMVRALSDATPEEGQVKAPWDSRKREYIEHLAELVDTGHPAVLVSACDKLHNASAIVADATDPEGKPGLDVFNRFTALPDQTAWYYGELLAAYERADLPTRLIAELRSTISRVQVLAGRATEAAQPQ